MTELQVLSSSKKIEELPKDNVSLYAQYLKNRVMKTNRNFMCCLIGQTGTGKSYTAIKLGELIDPDFGVKNIVFSQEEFIKLLPSLKRGSVIVYDEIGCSQNARDWYSETNKLLNNILATFRHLNLIVFFTVPAIIFVDKQARILFHGVIECKKISFDKKLGFVKPYFLKYNQYEDKIYNIFLKVCYKGEIKKIVSMAVPKANAELLKEYEKKRYAFTSQLYNIDFSKIKNKEEELAMRKNDESKKPIIQNLLNRGLSTKEIVAIADCSPAYVLRLKKLKKELADQELKTKSTDDLLKEFGYS